MTRPALVLSAPLAGRMGAGSGSLCLRSSELRPSRSTHARAVTRFRQRPIPDAPSTPGFVASRLISIPIAPQSTHPAPRFRSIGSYPPCTARRIRHSSLGASAAGPIPSASRLRGPQAVAGAQPNRPYATLRRQGAVSVRPAR